MPSNPPTAYIVLLRAVTPTAYLGGDSYRDTLYRQALWVETATEIQTGTVCLSVLEGQYRQTKQTYIQTYIKQYKDVKHSD